MRQCGGAPSQLALSARGQGPPPADGEPLARKHNPGSQGCSSLSHPPSRTCRAPLGLPAGGKPRPHHQAQRLAARPPWYRIGLPMVRSSRRRRRACAQVDREARARLPGAWCEAVPRLLLPPTWLPRLLLLLRRLLPKCCCGAAASARPARLRLPAQGLARHWQCCSCLPAASAGAGARPAAQRARERWRPSVCVCFGARPRRGLDRGAAARRASKRKLCGAASAPAPGRRAASGGRAHGGSRELEVLAQGTAATAAGNNSRQQRPATAPAKQHLARRGCKRRK